MSYVSKTFSGMFVYCSTGDLLVGWAWEGYKWWFVCYTCSDYCLTRREHSISPKHKIDNRGKLEAFVYKLEMETFCKMDVKLMENMQLICGPPNNLGESSFIPVTSYLCKIDVSVLG